MAIEELKILNEKLLDEKIKGLNLKFKNTDDKIDSTNRLLVKLIDKFDKYVEKHQEKHEADDDRCNLHIDLINKVDKKTELNKMKIGNNEIEIDSVNDKFEISEKSRTSNFKWIVGLGVMAGIAIIGFIINILASIISK